MKIPLIGILRIIISLICSVFGRGIGRIKVVQAVFRWFISWSIPKQYLTVPVNGYKLGMTVGGDKGFDEEALSLLFGAGYEVRMTELFKRIVKPDMNVVDVGAHIGYYTILTSKLVGEGGKVWAFEPDPPNYKELVDNIRLNHCENVEAIASAVGEKRDVAKLYRYGRFSGQRSLVNVGAKEHQSLGVEVVSLDELFHNQQVDVIKIDVDGGEMGVLTGMCELVKNNPDLKVFTEIWLVGLTDGGYTCAHVWSLLEAMGFRHIYLISDKLKTVNEINFDGLLRHLKHFEGANILCSQNPVAKEVLV